MLEKTPTKASMANKHYGSCLCEKVRFEIEGNFESFYLCHCKYCQKDTGAAHAANLFSTSANLIWLSGKDNIQTFNLPKTRHAKSFCKDCGSAFPSLQMNGTLLATPAGSLDSELDVLPNGHIFYSSKASWDKELEKIRKFEKYPE